ncbi:hypothetical protein [Frigoriglobus tundricola]|uniref:SWIM-type domain-containing protein n=1 Tax=Frigoriglobus tundricola TaxID=2774151 RepID=A0A6M5Z1K6_9BACT|nr:hypothetical protein [Frigoriglobus tundricola]QJX00298.1 hypothetical protein FTUN_7923 [Frigoriglobus tundricola]
MAAFTELLNATRSEKKGAVIWDRAKNNATSHVAGTLTITGTRSHCRYRVEEFGCDEGRGFMLFKLDAGSDATERQYGCFVGTNGQLQCECKGYHFTGHCRHLASLVTLIEAGQL